MVVDLSIIGQNYIGRSIQKTNKQKCNRMTPIQKFHILVSEVGVQWWTNTPVGSEVFITLVDMT